VGNIVGSNIFNILAILGACATVAPEPVIVSPDVLAFDLPVMAAVAVACLPVFFTGYRIGRGEGVLFLAFYAAYVGALVLMAVEHHALDEFSTVMLWFVLPLTALGLGGSVLAAWRRHGLRHARNDAS
jgi:cation:H+ antiporter